MQTFVNPWTLTGASWTSFLTSALGWLPPRASWSDLWTALVDGLQPEAILALPDAEQIVKKTLDTMDTDRLSSADSAVPSTVWEEPILQEAA